MQANDPEAAADKIEQMIDKAAEGRSNARSHIETHPVVESIKRLSREYGGATLAVAPEYDSGVVDPGEAVGFKIHANGVEARIKSSYGTQTRPVASLSGAKLASALELVDSRSFLSEAIAVTEEQTEGDREAGEAVN